MLQIGNISMINWDNFFKTSDTFKKNKPVKFAFIEEFFERKFYERLYEAFPKFDEAWSSFSGYDKSQKIEQWPKSKTGEYVDDPILSKEWNQFKNYAMSKEFVTNFRKYSGMEISKINLFDFTVYHKGDFQLAHLHNPPKPQLYAMLYFSKNWSKGDPGGTFLCKRDESSIFFEPYNLDNSMLCFRDGPKAYHGARYITKDVVRQALIIQFV